MEEYWNFRWLGGGTDQRLPAWWLRSTRPDEMHHREDDRHGRVLCAESRCSRTGGVRRFPVSRAYWP